MTNYTIDVNQVMGVTTSVEAVVTRDPIIWKTLIWVLIFSTIFIIFQHFLITFLEKIIIGRNVVFSDSDNGRKGYTTKGTIKKDKPWLKDLIIILFSLIILIVMIQTAIHYGPIDLLRPISSIFNVK